MSFPKFFKETLFLGLFLGFTTGSLTSSLYYQKQVINERKAFSECQQAWEKYYNLTKKPNTNQFNLTKQINRKLKLTSLTQKLNHYGWEIDQEVLEDFINYSFNHSIGIITYQIQQILPFTKYLSKYQEAKQFSQEEQRKRVYYSEVLPKCQKVKDWKKQMNSLEKNN